MESEEYRLQINQITERIIACVYRVSNTLGSGFLEKVYENALTIELRQNGLKVEQQHPIRVFYNSEPVGDFAADLLIEDSVIVELKSARKLDEVHAAQCLNYPRVPNMMKRAMRCHDFGSGREERPAA